MEYSSSKNYLLFCFQESKEDTLRIHQSSFSRRRSAKQCSALEFGHYKRTRNFRCCINCRRECNKSARPARERDRPGEDSPATRSLSARVRANNFPWAWPRSECSVIRPVGSKKTTSSNSARRTARRPGSQQPSKAFRVELFQPILPSQLLRPGTGRAPEPRHLRDGGTPFPDQSALGSPLPSGQPRAAPL